MATGDVYRWENTCNISIKILPLTTIPGLYTGMTIPKKVDNKFELRLTRKVFFKFEDCFKAVVCVADCKLTTTTESFAWTTQDLECVHYVGYLLGMIDKKMQEAANTDEHLKGNYDLSPPEKIEHEAIDLLKSRFELEN